MTRTPVVVKFGGAALADVEAVAGRLSTLRAGGRPVVAVVSAREGVTDRLLAAANGPSDSGAHRRALDDIRAAHPTGGPALGRRLAELERAFAWCERRDRLDGAATDRILAFGERLAVDWLVPELRARGLPSTGLDAAQIGMWTDGRHGAGTVLLDRSRRPVRHHVLGALARGELPVVTGYFGRGTAGEPVTLGRGGSDYAASALGVLVGAEFVELVKRHASVLSADPAEVPAARPIRSLTYEEAEELAEFGARVLHPMTVEPARLAGIELRIRSLGGAEEETVVGSRGGPPGIRAVTASPPVALFRMRFPGARGRTGVLSEICRRLSSAGVPVLQVFTSAAVVSVVTAANRSASARRVLRSTVVERSARLEPTVSVSLIAGIGSGAIADLPRYPRSLLEGAEGISATRASVTIAVPAHRRLAELRRLHRAVIERGTPRSRAPTAGRRAFPPPAGRPARAPPPPRTRRKAPRTS
ncbi:MAG: aspartate kinase [Thermoplasmata archaeon]|nr:aspartate kinase [Thermoplasmata archaeon]